MDLEPAKKAAAIEAVNHLKNNFILGLGSGSTAYFAIHEIANRINQGTLSITGGVPTSSSTEKIARQSGIVLLDNFDNIDVTIDGADEVDPNGNLIKGGGGALTREKIVAAASDSFIVIIDDSKLVNKLGAFPLPLEVLPFGWQATYNWVESLGCKVNIRKAEDEYFISDNGNYIFDCEFYEIDEPAKIAAELNQVPGVMENGLFINLAKIVVVGKENGTTETIRF